MWFERRESWFVMLWSVALGAVWMTPALWGYAMHITDHDTALYYYPIFDFYAKALQSGTSFLWLPGIFSGFPVYVSQVGGFFDPINILIFSFFSGIDGTHVRLFIDLVATGIFSYLAARSCGISPRASLLVGPSFLIAFHLRFLSNPVIANTLFLIPLLLYCANNLLDETLARWKIVAIFSLGIGNVLLSGYTQMTLYTLIAIGLYTSIRLLVEKKESIQSVLKKIYISIIGLVFGVVIGLPFLIPATSFLPLSTRVDPPSYEQATKKVVEFGDVVLFAVPDHFYIPYITAGKKPLYVGTVWFLFALAAFATAVLLVSRRRIYTRIESQLIATAGVLFIFLLLSIQYSPLYYLISKVPILDQFRFPYRFMYVGAFFLALLGAMGFDRILFLKERLVRRFLWVGIGIFSLLALFIVGVNSIGEASGSFLARTFHTGLIYSHFYEIAGLSKGDEHYATALVRAIEALQELLSFSDIAILIPTLVFISSILLFALYLLNRIGEKQFCSIALSITILTVIVIPILHYRDFVPLEKAGTLPHVALTHTSSSDRTLYRMYSFLPRSAVLEAIPPQYKLSRDEERAILEINAIGAFPNHHLYHALGSVDGYDQFETKDSLTALELIGGALYAGYDSGSDEERRERLLEHLDVLSMMGGKYLISGLELENPRLKLLSDDVYTAYNIRLWVYELDALPRYYLVDSVHAQRHTSFQDLIKNGVPVFDEGTYLDCSDCAENVGGGKVAATVYTNGHYVFTADLPKDRYFVLSESFLPGWRATIDGIVVEPIRANGLYMAIRIPEGHHDVEFEYQGLMNELSILKILGIVRIDSSQ